MGRLTQEALSSYQMAWEMTREWVEVACDAAEAAKRQRDLLPHEQARWQTEADTLRVVLSVMQDWDPGKGTEDQRRVRRIQTSPVIAARMGVSKGHRHVPSRQ